MDCFDLDHIADKDKNMSLLIEDYVLYKLIKNVCNLPTVTVDQKMRSGK